MGTFECLNIGGEYFVLLANGKLEGIDVVALLDGGKEKGSLDDCGSDAEETVAENDCGK